MNKQLGAAGLGMELMAAVGGGTLLGLWIDRHFQTGPWGAVVGGLVGIVGGLVNFVRQARRAMDESSSSARDASSREDSER